MTTSTLNLRCQKCGHEWPEMFQMGVTVKSFLTRLKGLNMCPQCNHKRIDIVTGDQSEVSMTCKVPLHCLHPWIYHKDDPWFGNYRECPTCGKYERLPE